MYSLEILISNIVILSVICISITLLYYDSLKYNITFNLI